MPKDIYHLSEQHPNALLVFLPSTNPLLWLLEQGGIANFQMIHLQQTLMCLLKVTDKSHRPSVHEFFARASTCNVPLNRFFAAWDWGIIEQKQMKPQPLELSKTMLTGGVLGQTLV